MGEGLLIDIKRIFRVLIGKFWLFLLVLLAFVGVSIFKTNEPGDVLSSYNATGKILVIQGSSKEVGELMDNSARMQPTYDAIELLTSGVFLERVKNTISFDIAVGELRSSVTYEQLLPTRILDIKVTRSNMNEVAEILESIQENAKDYLEEVLSDVNVEILETTETIDIKQEQNSVNSIKIGILMGIAACIILAFVLIAICVMNDSIRYKDDVRRYLGIPVIGMFPDKQKIRRGN